MAEESAFSETVLPSRITSRPVTLAEYVAVYGVLASMSIEVRQLMQEPNISPQMLEMCATMWHGIGVWQQWMRDNPITDVMRPNADSGFVSRFDVLVFADIEDFERRIAIVRESLGITERKYYILLPVGAAALFGLYLLMKKSK